MKVCILIVGQKRTFDALYKHIYEAVKQVCSVSSDVFICLDDSPHPFLNADIRDLFKPKEVIFYDANANMHQCRSERSGFQAAFGIHTAYRSIFNAEKEQGTI